jgi:hypothetical protein
MFVKIKEISPSRIKTSTPNKSRPTVDLMILIAVISQSLSVRTTFLDAHSLKTIEKHFARLSAHACHQIIRSSGESDGGS